ncbi:hypothetical protein JCM8547_006608 [Rhodosporidiobolus lusitaniae]
MLHRLPDSVIHSVLSYALPWPSSHHAVPLRYQLLLGYSMLSRALARVTQQLLFDYVNLTTSVAVDEFCRTVDESVGGRRLAFTRTKRVRIGLPGRHDQDLKIGKARVHAVLRRVPAVRDLWVDGVSFDPLALSVCVDLRTLRLSHLMLHHVPSVSSPVKNNRSTPDLQTWFLPHLTSLSLVLVSYIDVENLFVPVSDLLTPLALPALTTLCFTYDAETSDPEFAPIAPQLTHLWLRRLPTKPPRVPTGQPPSPPPTIAPLPDTELAACSRKLTHLAIDLYSNVDFPALEHIGSQSFPAAAAAKDDDAAEDVMLRTLRLESNQPTNAERAVLDGEIPAFEILDAMLVADVSGLPAELVFEECEKRAATRKELEGRGVKLVEWEFHGNTLTGELQKWEEEAWAGWCREIEREAEELREEVAEAEKEREEDGERDEGRDEEEDAEKGEEAQGEVLPEYANIEDLQVLDELLNALELSRERFRRKLLQSEGRRVLEEVASAANQAAGWTTLVDLPLQGSAETWTAHLDILTGEISLQRDARWAVKQLFQTLRWNNEREGQGYDEGGYESSKDSAGQWISQLGLTAPVVRQSRSVGRPAPTPPPCYAALDRSTSTPLEHALASLRALNKIPDRAWVLWEEHVRRFFLPTRWGEMSLGEKEALVGVLTGSLKEGVEQAEWTRGTQWSRYTLTKPEILYAFAKSAAAQHHSTTPSASMDSLSHRVPTPDINLRRALRIGKKREDWAEEAKRWIRQF